MSNAVTIGPLIADSGRVGLAYAKRMIAGVSASQFGRFAKVGDTTIISNHPAFIFGHLSLYACRVVAQLGGDASSIVPTDKYNALFNHTAKCVDDPAGTIYPPMDELTERLFAGYELAVATLGQAEDRLFLVPNENEAMRARFATNGSMIGFYIGGHFMMHIGQMSTWRRAVGLPPA